MFVAVLNMYAVELMIQSKSSHDKALILELKCFGYTYLCYICYSLLSINVLTSEIQINFGLGLFQNRHHFS